MALQTIAVRLGRFTVAANAAYFHTDDYDSRLYAYERTTLYNFSFPSFFGEGIRGALFLRADISKNLVLIGKAGTTKYFDRNSHTALGRTAFVKDVGLEFVPEMAQGGKDRIRGGLAQGRTGMRR